MRALPARTGFSLLITVAAAAVLVTQGAAAAAPDPGFGGSDWLVAGHDPGNTRDADTEHILNSGDVSRLDVAWSVPTTSLVSSTPTVQDGTVYFPDSGGKLWAVDAHSGHVRWSHDVSDYTGITGDLARTSPAVYGDELVLGDTNPARAGAVLFTVDKRTGQALWHTNLDTHPAAIVSSSPVVYQGTIYVGVSSDEEDLATAPGYPCCSFRGSVVALDAATGRIRWQTHTVPTGYAGGAVWGSSPMIDPRNNLLYVGTGNNYSAPPGVCAEPGQTGCTPPAAADHADSILALDRTTGALRWATSTMSADVFTDLCGSHPAAACGPDFDFGSDPNLIELGGGRQLIGIGQKSGVYWALDPNTGAVVWHTQVGPGSALGGIEYSSATDSRRIYVAISNLFGQPYQITSATGQTTTTSGGSWAALDPATGRIQWQVADPQQAADLGYVSTANGVVYAGSTALNGNEMYALDAATGAIRWGFDAGGPVVAGASIADGMVFWGSGFPLATACPGGALATRVCSTPTTRTYHLYAFRLR